MGRSNLLMVNLCEPTSVWRCSLIVRVQDSALGVRNLTLPSFSLSPPSSLGESPLLRCRVAAAKLALACFLRVEVLSSPGSVGTL